MKQLVIWHGELALSIGLGEYGSVPIDLINQLIPAMSYVHVQNLSRDAQRQRESGDRRKYEFIPTDLYDYEEARHPETGELIRRFVCPTGYLSRVLETAATLGYEVDFRDSKFADTNQYRPGTFDMDWERLANYFTPRIKQDECIAAIASNWYGQIAAAPGFGKTKLIGALGLGYSKATHLLVVPNKDVMYQARDHVAEYIPAGSIGLIGDGKNQEERFSIIIINSLARKAWQMKPDFLWVDECHGMVSNRWAEAIQIVGRRARVFGLSGSLVERFDKANNRFESLFGKPIFSITQKEAEAAKLIVPITVYFHDVIMDRNPVEGLKNDTARKRHGIWRNSTRNNLIAQVANNYSPEEQVLILVESVQHALELAKRLPDYFICCGSLAKRLEENYVAESKIAIERIAVLGKDQRDAIAKFLSGERPKLIGTGKLGTGFSPDALSVLIRADAQSSSVKSIQWPDRANRRHDASGKQGAIMHDFLDQFDDKFKRAASTRIRDYDELGFTLVKARDGSQIKVRRKAQAV